MIHNQEAIQAALDSKSMRAYGKLDRVLQNAWEIGLITTKQLQELEANLEALSVGNNVANIKPVVF